MIRLKKSRNTIEMRVTYVFEWKLFKRESRKHTENVTCSKIYLRIPYTVSSYLLLPFSGFRGGGGAGRISYGWWWYESVCVYLCTCLFNIAHNRNNPPTPHLHSRHIYILYYVRYLPLSYNFTALTCLPYREQLMGVRGCSSIHVRLYSK